MGEPAQILDPQRIAAGEVPEPLRKAARAADTWQVMHRPQGRGAFQKRVERALEDLKALERALARLRLEPNDPEAARTPHRAALLELKANPRMLRAAVGAVSDRPHAVSRLPRVTPTDGGGEEPRVARIAEVYLAAVDGVFSGLTIAAFLRELQRREPLTIDELWSIAPFLKFALLEMMLAEAQVLLGKPETVGEAKIASRMKSLRTVSNTDWVYLIEPLIVLDATLRQDPAQSYANMDFESREHYRKRIAFVARYSDCSEPQVADIALELARAGAQSGDADARVRRKHMHIGYYLVDEGFAELSRRIGFHPPLNDRARRFISANSEDSYLTAIEIVSVLVIAAVLFPVLPHSSGYIGLLIAFVLLIVPAMQDAIDLVNNAVSTLFDPEPLPKLDFSKGIPFEYTTLVAVPTLLLSDKQVRELVKDLEVRFLANRDPNLHFALLTDLPDAVAEPRDKDAHPLVELAIDLINQLNRKYQSSRNGSFLLLHRHRVFNHRQGVWMGWERKRGKLLDLNKLFMGTFDAFPIKAGRLDVLRYARYVLTLDTDTQLPRGTAARLVGAMAHPLNQAIIDPKRRVVTAGYGILQPRIGIAVQSAARSRLASIYSGQNGFDIYTRAISDAYQDLFHEGIFTGKGIYEIATLHAVLDRRFPRNSLLSHDLIEGAYARAGQATDVELIDDYPSHYSAYSRRKHRWVRGDWQILQWMFSRVPDESGHMVPNPISSISRWKILDNLRRSLLDPSLLILFVAGWLGLPGGPLYWTLATFLLLMFPSIAQIGFAVARVLMSERRESLTEAFAGFGRGALVALLNLIFLVHQMLLAFDAIIRSLVRLFISGERLLEWETAAEAEEHGRRRTPVDRYLALTPLVAAGLGALVYVASPHRDAIWIALPVLLLWALAGPVTVWLNQPPKEQSQHLTSIDRTYLMGHALRIWRYFYEFGAERHHYLIPDNVEEDGPYEAPRVSPTNLGLLLNARQAASELGFLTAPEFAALTQRTLSSVRQLEKFRGHLYNWYDTQTLKPLHGDPFVSSVDSGNFVASLYTLHAGAREMRKQPLLSPRLFHGLRVHWMLVQEQGKMPPRLVGLNWPAPGATLAQWVAWFPAFEEALVSPGVEESARFKDAWWYRETLNRCAAIRTLLRDYVPWVLPAYAKLRTLPQIAIDDKSMGVSIEGALECAESIDARIARAWSTLSADDELFPLGEELRAALTQAKEKVRNLLADLDAIAAEAERLADETEFGFLVDPDRQILSIGYDMGKQKVHEACYDMLASEARIATFLAVARGDLKQESWFKLARDFAQAFGHFLLLSWTGTMFEYLMPALWMRNYPNTLIARTLAACVAVQRDFAQKLGIPWGISESGSSRKDDAGHYHYQAYGVPQIALWYEAEAGPVISPYSTFLALGVDCREALHNLHRMEGMGWIGPFGFYESADFTESLRKPALAREWMAHHQGMALLAITNLLCGNVVQEWFHANPLIESAELLLHEMPTSRSVMRARLKELAPVAAQ